MSAQRNPSTSPAMRAYANELTAWREEVEYTKAEASRLLGYTPQYVGQIEDCKNKPSRKFSEDCDTFFKTNGVFVRLWKNLNETRHLAVLPPGFPEYLEREKEADTIRIFSALLIHGLFQTEDVVRAIMSGASDTETAAELGDKRLERHANVLNRENPPQIFLFIDETVLRRVVGGKDAHRAQLQHLINLAERPSLQIQVIPQDCDYYPGLTGSFTLFTFEDGSQSAYTESAGNGMLIEEPARIASYVVRCDLIRGHARSASESLAMIRTVMEDL